MAANRIEVLFGLVWPLFDKIEGGFIFMSDFLGSRSGFGLPMSVQLHSSTKNHHP